MTRFYFRIGKPLFTLFAAGLIVVSISKTTNAELVSFLVDPSTIDTNMDGFITGNEFAPVGSDGTIFSLTPTDNLVGANRFLLSDTSGLQYGGGGGSTISFDFEVSHDISLESYTLASSGFFLNNPEFDLLEGATVLSSLNTSNNSGDTHAFNGGPINLTAGTVYSFEAQVSGAAVQAFMGSWTYTQTSVPEPGSAAIFALAGTVCCLRRRR